MNNTYYDKVLGCWLGKCIGGNIGAPYEGMKQRMALKYTSKFVDDILPNDDLDLQIIWLDLLEKKGRNITSFDMAKAFAENCPYAPGEYAYFMKNFDKGIMPPLSGTFNNEFYAEGMGSPIRSEIWACLFHDEPEIAIQYAIMDSCLDHHAKRESEYGEVFLTALECFCFVGGEPFELVEKAIEYLPDSSEIKSEMKDLLNWCKESKDMEKIQRAIIRKYGHSESCMAKQNIGFLIAAFLLHGDNFIDAVMEAVNCGFDADCTGASLGAIIGILLGGEKLKEIFGISDMTFKLGVKSAREQCTVSALTDAVVQLSEKLKAEPVTRFAWNVTQAGNPCISFGEKDKTVLLKIIAPYDAEIKISMSQPAVLKRNTYSVKKGENEVEISVSLLDCDMLPEGLAGSVLCDEKEIGRFGLSVRRKWKVYGPYWKNETVIPPLQIGEKYSAYLQGETLDEKSDHKRLFHLSCIPDHQYDGREEQLSTEYFDVVDTETDIVKLNECTHFKGNAVYYFETSFFVEKNETVGLQIGASVPITVWLNGEFLAKKSRNETFYYETIHKLALSLKKGKNILLFKVENNAESAKFSYNFLSKGVCSKHKCYQMENIRG